MSRTISGMTHLGQELQDISFLLAQGKHGGQNALNKKAALFTLCTITMFSPKDTTPQRAFCGVISGFNALMVDKGPQSRFEFEDIGAGFSRRGLIELQAKLQQSFDFSLNGLDKNGKVRPAQSAISDAMPMAKQEFSLLEQQLADNPRLAAPIDQGLKIPFHRGV